MSCRFAKEKFMFHCFQMLGPCCFTWIWARDRLHDDWDSLPIACQKKRRLNPREFHQKKPDPQIVWTEPRDCFQRELLHLDLTPNLCHWSPAEHCLYVVEELKGCSWAGPEKKWAWMKEVQSRSEPERFLKEALKGMDGQGWGLDDDYATKLLHVTHRNRQPSPSPPPPIVDQIFGPAKLLRGWSNCSALWKFGANMGQRLECGYEKMGADSYKSQNWLSPVNMTNVHESFYENLHICKSTFSTAQVSNLEK